jgi:hypothetical protein
VTTSGSASFHVSGNHSVGGQSKWAWTETIDSSGTGSGSGSGSGSSYTTSSNGGDSWSSGGSYSTSVDYWGFYEGNYGTYFNGSASSIYFGEGEGWTGPGSPSDTASGSGGGYLDTYTSVSEAEPGPYGGPLSGTTIGPASAVAEMAPVMEAVEPQTSVTPDQFNAALNASISVAQGLTRTPSVSSPPAELGPLSAAIGAYAEQNMPVAKAPPLSEVENEPPKQAQPNPGDNANNLLAFAGADETKAAKSGEKAPAPIEVDAKQLSKEQLQKAKQLAELSRAVYKGENREVEGFKPIQVWDDTNGAPKGFRAVLYQNTTTKEYVLAFSGTDDYADAKADDNQAAGELTPQYEYAIKLAKTFMTEKTKETYEGKLELTGHSLGGGLATAASLCSIFPATVFNAAGVHENTVKDHKGDITKIPNRITGFRNKAEPVTTIENSLLGQVILGVPGTVETMMATLHKKLPLSPLSRHRIGAIIDALDAEIKQKEQQEEKP